MFNRLECLKTNECKGNPKNFFTTKVGEHIPSGFQFLQYYCLKA